MIYSPFYRPRYPLPYFRRPTDNVYTYSIKQDKKGFEKENFKKDLKFLKEENDKKDTFNNYPVVNNLKLFSSLSDIILANRVDKELEPVKKKVYTRDLFTRD